MGGTKRKIKIEKIKNKTTKSVAFTKRRMGLFHKASELCLLSPGTQIAILATPPSSNSHASFYSFGHSSVDHVVSSLLNDQVPLPLINQENNNSKLGFWWEDEAFDRCENVDDLNNACDAITRMLSKLRVRVDAVNSNQRVEDGVMINQITKFEGVSGTSANLFEINDDDFLNMVEEEHPPLQILNNSEEEATNQITIFEGTNSASANLVEMKNKSEETVNQVTKFEGTNSASASVFENGEDLQFQNTMMNSSEEEAMNQITKFEGTNSGSANLVENDEDLMHMAACFDDVNFDLLF